MDCTGCKWFGTKDDGYYEKERHDSYCFKYYEWLPFRCSDYDLEEDA